MDDAQPVGLGQALGDLPGDRTALPTGRAPIRWMRLFRSSPRTYSMVM